MNQYPHIDSVYKRDLKGKFLLGEFSTPEFEYLKDLPWVWTEKIDGTNIRIMWRGLGEFLTLGGKTDNAQIPAKLVAWLNERISANKFAEVFPDTDPTKGEGICLYGEGYGAGIQKGGGNYSAEQKFILFDVKIGHWWLQRKDIEDIGIKLGLDVVRQYAPTTLESMVDFVSDGLVLESAFYLPDRKPEGYVGQPLIPLMNRKCGRIITKVKYKDFK